MTYRLRSVAGTSEAASGTVVALRLSLVAFFLSASTCEASGLGPIAKFTFALATLVARVY